MNLLHSILRHALLKPKTIAVIDDQRSYTYARLVLGAYYLRRTIRRTTTAKHVGIMLPTSGAFPLALLASWLAGRVAVPLNYLLSKDELAYVIKDSDIDTLITVGPMLEYIGGESSIPPGIKLIKLEQQKFTGFPPLAPPPRTAPDDLAVLLYTSGTSGKPKGVMLTHDNLRSNVDAAVDHANLRPNDSVLGVLPQFHSFGLTVLTLLPLRLGAKVVYTARFVPRKLIALLREHRPTLFVAIPSMYGGLLSVKNAGPEDFQSIRVGVSGGEPLPDAVYQQFLERFDFKILEGYGLTETSPATNWSKPDSYKRHSVGPTLPDVRNFIVDEQFNFLPPGQEGEILITGPNVMAGYYKQPQLTDQVIRHLTPPGESGPIRVFCTGDIGHIDDDGLLYITGRKKEMLIIGGENVFPREIEEVLVRHPAIHAAAVIGKQDTMRGQVPIAFVELNPHSHNEAFDPASLREFCRHQLAQFKIPREIHVVDQLPRNPTGKILRRKLNEPSPSD